MLPPYPLMPDSKLELGFSKTGVGWTQGEHADANRCYNNEEVKKAVWQMLGSRGDNIGIWVFGYGSLMWNPDVRYQEIRKGRLEGFHRRLCLSSTVYRGTPETPGVVLGLAPGGFCEGSAFFILREDLDPDLIQLWDREMFANTYIPRWLMVQTESGEIEALVFVANNEHEYFLPPMELEEVASIVNSGKGQRGACLDYVRNTIHILHQLEIRDPFLERILMLTEYKPGKKNCRNIH